MNYDRTSASCKDSPACPRSQSILPTCGPPADLPTARPFGKRGSAHHSLRRFVTCYPVLRIEAPGHSPWRAPRDDLNDSSYQRTVLDFSISQAHEEALVGEPGEAVRRH